MVNPNNKRHTTHMDDFSITSTPQLQHLLQLLLITLSVSNSSIYALEYFPRYSHF